MNIGVDIKALYKGKAGIAAYIRNTLDKLQETDHANRYFLFEKRPSSYTTTNPRFQKILVPSRLPGTLWLMFILPFHLKKYSIGVFWGPEQLIPCVFGQAGVKMVSTILDLTLLHYPETMQTTNFLVNRLFLRRSVCKSDKILTISNFIKKDICESFPRGATSDNVVVTYPGSPEWEKTWVAAQGRGEHLLFVGSFEPRKNLSSLLKALCFLKDERNRAISLRIVGPPGWKNDAVHHFIKTNNLEGHVTFKGYCGETELAREYASCKAFVYPSLYEGFGLPVLEALAANTLVLSSGGTVMDEIAGGCFVSFDPANPRDIAEKILTVYQKDFDPTPYLKGAKDVLARYSWKSTAEKTMEVLMTV
ncbi:MAG TPA: glycosyltransferase family 1 protein [Chitinivibrionales bacterium]|nr:glycosyltransferase family 1 protein [Chitinivibrionales bacterium]